MRYAYATGTYVYKLKGYSKKISQLCNIPNQTIQEHGINFTVQDNEVSMTGAFNDDVYYVNIYREATASNIKINHKYFLRIKTNKNVANSIGIVLNNPYIEFRSGENGTIWTCTATTYLYFRVYQKSTTYTGSFDGVKCKFEIIDLTADFGAGNEPTTIAQCEAYYGNKYIPYGEQILNCKMPIKAYKDGVEVAQIDCGRDLLFNDTLTTDGKVDVGSGKVDLGSLGWSYNTTLSADRPHFYSTDLVNVINKHSSDFSIAKWLICDKYRSTNGIVETNPNGTISGRPWHTDGNILVFDFNYTNVADFKTAMNGVMLDYELAQHTTSTFTPISLKDNLTFVDDNGYEVEVLESNFEVKKWKAVKKSRNLIDITKFVLGRVEGSGKITTEKDYPIGEILSTTNDGITFRVDRTWHGVISDFCKVTPNKTYYIKYNCTTPYSENVVYGFDKDKNFVSRLAIRYTTIQEFPIIVPTGNIEYLLFSNQYSQTGEKYLSNIQLEEGSTATAYEPYGLKSYLPTTRLPLEYQEVKYLESTGTQYIDTGVIPNSNQSYSIKFKYNELSQNAVVFGSRSTGTYNTSRNQLYLNYNTGTSAYNILYNRYLINDLILSIATTTEPTEYKDIRNTDTVMENATQPFYLFSLNNLGTASVFSKIRLYYFLVGSGNTIINAFISCYRRSDHKPGMYDIVNNVFYTNQGTGEFILGEEI